MSDESNSIRRTVGADKSFIEGLKGDGEHVHYNSSGGSDVPVHWRNERTGEGVSLRSLPIGEALDRIRKSRES